MFTFKELNEIFKNAFKRPAWPETDKNFPLPPGMKFEEGQLIAELDLGPSDILIIQSQRYLNPEQRVMIKDRAEEALKAPGRACFILDAGLTYSVLHRKDSDE
jgi:hypothetical protein